MEPITEAPQVGFYKMRDGRDGPYLPVAIWMHEGEMVCRVGANMRKPDDVWLWCAKNPVDRDECRIAMQTGRWPGDAPEADEVPSIGDNGAPLEPFEEFEREVDVEHERIKAWVAEEREGKIACDQAANWLDNLLKLEKRVFDAFDAEKKPVREMGQSIDAKWRHVKLRAEACKNIMRGYYDEIGRKEQRRLQDIADAKAAEDAARQQAQANELAEQQGVEAPEIEPVEAEPVKVNFGGANGSKIAPRKAKPTATITDWAKAAAYYADNEKLRALVQKLANADAVDGVIADGCEIVNPN